METNKILQDAAKIILIDANMKRLGSMIDKAEHNLITKCDKDSFVDAIDIIETFTPKLGKLEEEKNRILDNSEYLIEV